MKLPYVTSRSHNECIKICKARTDYVVLETKAALFPVINSTDKMSWLYFYCNGNSMYTDGTIVSTIDCQWQKVEDVMKYSEVRWCKKPSGQNTPEQRAVCEPKGVISVAFNRGSPEP